MANDLNESYLNLPDSDEEDGLVNFSQYYFKEWSEVEALYKMTMYNDSLDEKEQLSETSEEESEMEKDSSDEEVDEDCIEILGKALDNMLLSKPNLMYQNPIIEANCFAELDLLTGSDTANTTDEGWRSDDMDDDFESSSDEESSSLTD